MENVKNIIYKLMKILNFKWLSILYVLFVLSSCATSLYELADLTPQSSSKGIALFYIEMSSSFNLRSDEKKN
jgi:hypothetical protein